MLQKNNNKYLLTGQPTHTILGRFRAGRLMNPRAVAAVGLEVGPEEGLGYKCFLLCEPGHWGLVWVSSPQNEPRARIRVRVRIGIGRNKGRCSGAARGRCVLQVFSPAKSNLRHSWDWRTSKRGTAVLGGCQGKVWVSIFLPAVSFAWAMAEGLVPDPSCKIAGLLFALYFSRKLLELIKLYI